MMSLKMAAENLGTAMEMSLERADPLRQICFRIIRPTSIISFNTIIQKFISIFVIIIPISDFSLCFRASRSSLLRAKKCKNNK